MAELKYFIVGIFISLLLMLATEAVYAKEPVEVIAYANDAIDTVIIKRKTPRVIEKIWEQKEAAEIEGQKTPVANTQKPATSQIEPVPEDVTTVKESLSKIAMQEPDKRRLLSRKELNEGGARMFERLFMLPIMYSNIRKKK